MGVRRLARQHALQLLFSLDYPSGKSFEEAEEDYLAAGKPRRKAWTDFARALARATWSRRRELDAEISGSLKNWKLERLTRVDKLCLRMALCELMFFDQIPLRVTLNEYVELARVFGGDDSPQFVNGVLDALAKKFPQKDFQAGDERVGDPPDAELEPDDAVMDEAVIEEDRRGAGREEHPQ